MSRWGLIDNSIEGRQKLYFPHFAAGRVPLDPELNRRWRQRAFLTAKRSEQKLLKKMAAEDLIFYVAGWCYLFDAGDESGKPGPVPFVPYEFQVELFTSLWAAMHDMRCPARVRKPRKLGLTWMTTAMFSHAWQFMRDCHLLVGSHREEEVDGSVNMGRSGQWSGEWSKLLCKIDHLHIYQPRWLLPPGYIPRAEPYRTRMKIMNPDNGSIIWGTSASSRAGHGSRGYAVLFDEASRVENLHEIIGGLSEFAPCKLWVSTIGDLSHPFSTVLRDAPGVMQLKPEWHHHPEYSKGMTIDEHGVRSSPWLKKKLDEINHDPILANAMYFADENIQVGGFYHPKTFEIMLGVDHNRNIYAKLPTVMDPLHVGELDIADFKEGPRVTRFCQQRGGRWKLWFNFDPAGTPPRSTKYIGGADIAAGTVDSGGRGASNSVIAFVDWMTGEIVAEFVADGVPPHELARIACAAGHWFEGDDFGEAKFTFERNGPFGAAFGKELYETYRYGNIWRAVDGKLGWYKPGTEEASKAFALHQMMIIDGRLKERSRWCVDEMRHYQTPASGKGAPVHTSSLYSEDPSGARDNHGDRVIARVVLCQVLERPYELVQKKGEAPWGSARMIQERQRRSTWQSQLA